MYAWLDSAQSPGSASAPGWPEAGQALFVSDRKRSEAKIWFWVENHPEWGLRMGANKVPDVDHHLEVVDYIVEILLAGCEDGS